MAPPAKVGPPATLPADFFDKNLPETLPENFNFDDAPAVPRGTLRAAPTGAVPWLEQAESDLLHGGSSTVLGRILGTMEGRGKKGYSGLESGVSSDTAQFMGSPVLGAIKGARGLAETATGHPLTGIKDVALGALQASTIPASFIAPEAGGEGTEIRSILRIPNEAHAGRMLGEIRPIAESTGTVVQPAKTVPALQSWRELMQTGGKPSGQKAIASLEKLQLGTLAKPAEPVSMAWPEASLRYSNIAEQGREPVLQKLMGRGMTPKVSAAANGVRSGLRSDLSSAAESMGQGKKFEDAMQEYRRAAKLNKVGRIGAGLAAGEAARRTGLLGNWIHRSALQQ